MDDWRLIQYLDHIWTVQLHHTQGGVRVDSKYNITISCCYQFAPNSSLKPTTIKQPRRSQNVNQRISRRCADQEWRQHAYALTTCSYYSRLSDRIGRHLSIPSVHSELPEGEVPWRLCLLRNLSGYGWLHVPIVTLSIGKNKVFLLRGRAWGQIGPYFKTSNYAYIRSL